MAQGAEALTAVRIRVPRTFMRFGLGLCGVAVMVLIVLSEGYVVFSMLAFGDTSLVTIALVNLAILVVGGLALWSITRLNLVRRQIVAIEDGTLVSYFEGPLGRTRPFRISLDRIGSARFIVQQFPRDAGHPGYRPQLAARVMLARDGDRLLQAGLSLTPDEGRDAGATLNRLLDEYAHATRGDWGDRLPA